MRDLPGIRLERFADAANVMAPIKIGRAQLRAEHRDMVEPGGRWPGIGKMKKGVIDGGDDAGHIRDPGGGKENQGRTIAIALLTIITKAAGTGRIRRHSPL